MFYVNWKNRIIFKPCMFFNIAQFMLKCLILRKKMEQLYLSEQIQINFSSVDKLPKLYRSCATSLKLHKMLCRGF